MRLRGTQATLPQNGGGFELPVAPASVTALLGAPGSGKSAVMRALCGPGGTAALGLGRDTAGGPLDLPSVGVVRQPDRLSATLTLAQNVALPLRTAKMPRSWQAGLVSEIMDQLGLTRAAALRPDQASPALRQRAVLARAVVIQPRVLLLDEPFCDQDMAGRAELAASLRRLHALLGTTTLLATAQGSDALDTADRIAVLQDGRLVQHDTSHAIYDRPTSAYAARLLGEVNSLAGRVEEVFDDSSAIRLACGPLVEAAAPGMVPGDPCVLVLRPQRIALAAVPAAEMGEGAVEATVIEARCQGESWRVSVLIGSGAEVVVRRPAAAGSRGMAQGAQVAIAWQPHHALALPLDA